MDIETLRPNKEPSKQVKALEPYQASRLIDIRQHVRLGDYGQGRARVGFSTSEDILFLLELIEQLRKTEPTNVNA